MPAETTEPMMDWRDIASHDVPV